MAAITLLKYIDVGLHEERMPLFWIHSIPKVFKVTCATCTNIVLCFLQESKYI